MTSMRTLSPGYKMAILLLMTALGATLLTSIGSATGFDEGFWSPHGHPCEDEELGPCQQWFVGPGAPMGVFCCSEEIDHGGRGGMLNCQRLQDPHE